ncbi:MAG: S9 family peptidase [Pyrinomonadaceae bacterium]
MNPRIAPYGSWKSAITSELIVTEAVGLAQPKVDGPDRYWIEMRPSEGGRNVIVRCDSDGRQTDVTPPGFNARTRVHEYGGGDYAVQQGTVFFSNFADQRLYRQAPGSQPEPLTPEWGKESSPGQEPACYWRYADPVVDARRQRLLCIREDHSNRGHEAINTIVSLRFDGSDGAGQVLVSGNDFYSSPRVSPDGSRLAWLTWNHPNMPWDGSEVWVGDIESDGAIVNQQLVAGGIAESIFQPEWSPDGVLYFVSDRSGWWNIYCQGVDGRTELVHAREANFGAPQWVFGMSTYAFASATQIVCAYAELGIWRLATIDTGDRSFKPIATPYTDISFLRAAGELVTFRGGSPTETASIVDFNLLSGETTVLRRSKNIDLDPGYLSIPKPIEFPTEGGLTAHAYFYPPLNPDYAAPPGERPPLLVKSHGGPTSAAVTTLSLSLQYWTSRGIAVLDVNYGGSTGYGREYRRRLDGKWGIVDVDDCANGALFLVGEGKVDGERLMIDGGSAGGYTTLCALTFRDLFKAGASFFGVGDAEALAKETHKFESRYLDGLIGPYPERRDLYVERSPINFTDRLSCPVIFFQGLEDKVVPPNQAETMVEALRLKKVPVAYVAFPGEQHGFRRAENIRRSLDGELYFYSRVFGFELAEQLEPVEIENL